MVLFVMLNKVVLTFESVENVIIQMKGVEQESLLSSTFLWWCVYYAQCFK